MKNCNNPHCLQFAGKLRILIMWAGVTMNIRANTITSHRTISKIIPLHWKNGSRGGRRLRPYSQSR